MTDDPIYLDEHRCKAIPKTSEVFQQYLEIQSDQAALYRQQHEFDSLLLDTPAKTCSEAAIAAQYLIQLFAATPEGQDPRRQELIAHALDGLARLCDCEQGD